MIVPYDDPETAIKIIEALADQTRRRILLYIQENPDGVTASSIAKTVNKKIPTVLHHLEIFDKLDLIRSEMKSVDSGGRDVKHWFMKQERLTIEIEFSAIAFVPDEIIIDLFENLKERKGLITPQLLSAGFSESDILAVSPGLTERQLDIISKSLQKQYEYYLQKWIDRAYDDSDYALALNLMEFENYFALERDLAGRMFYELANSKDYYFSQLQSCVNPECNFVLQHQNYRFCPNCGTKVEEETSKRLMKRKA